MTFIPGIRVLMSLISSTPQSLEVSSILIMIYIKKNRCEISEIIFRYVLTKGTSYVGLRYYAMAQWGN